jgi:hypothetical protein
MGRLPRGVQQRGSDCVRPRCTLPATVPPEVGARSDGEYHLRTLQLIMKNIRPQFDPVGLFVAITSKSNLLTIIFWRGDLGVAVRTADNLLHLGSASNDQPTAAR